MGHRNAASSKSPTRLVVSTVVTAMLVLLIALVFFEWRASPRESRAQVLELVRAIDHGTTKREIAEILNSELFDRLTLREIDEVTWFVQTPVQFGARNWVLWIEFEQDEVKSVRVRTHDEKTEHPEGAPEDRVFR